MREEYLNIIVMDHHLLMSFLKDWKKAMAGNVDSSVSSPYQKFGENCNGSYVINNCIG